MRYKKDPDATLDYTIDWSEWLAAVDDTIVSSTWVLASGLVSVSDSFTDTAATIFVSGGTAGQTLTMTNRITTAVGRTDDRTITLQIVDR